MSIAHIKVRSQNSFHLDITREIASLEGHLFALPILFINLGGEMMYVIEHRLRAQGLEDRMDKVMQDVIGTIFRPRIIDELFKPQHLLSESSMRSLFQKLAHASIMSLNQESMDKLLDLMTMTVKYQVFNCRYPLEMIYCTLNHLDYMRDLVKHSETISNSLRKVYNHIERTYCRMDQQNLVLLRNIILRFFQDRKTRLSVFLNTGFQKETDGSMRIPSTFEISPASMTVIPGKIIIYKTTGEAPSKETTEAKTEIFPAGGNFTMGTKTVQQSSAFDVPIGGRGTKLGTNVFSNYKGPNVAKTMSSGPTGVATIKSSGTNEFGEEKLVLSAAGAAEMAMLARILGTSGDDSNRSSPTTSFELDFMADSEDKSAEVFGQTPTVTAARARASQIVRVEFTKDKLKDIDLGLLDESKLRDASFDGMDLLQLMDEAAGK